MHILRTTLFASTALVFIAPAQAQAPAGDLTCAEEVERFLETVRQDDAFADVEAAFARWPEVYQPAADTHTPIWSKRHA